MKPVLLVLVCVALVHGKALPRGVDFVNFKLPKIVNGGDASPGEWKWQASLQHCFLGFFCSHSCGAVLIDRTTLVTAAHCVDSDSNVNNYKIILGEHDRSSNSGNEQTLTATSMKVHENWDSNTIQNDIAIIKLQTSAALNTFVQPVDLPSAGQQFLGDECWISGWGKTDGASSDIPNILQEVRVETITNSDCMNRDAVFNDHVKSHMVCIQGYNKDAGACNGDSGGPLTCKVGGSWVLAGVTSWGKSGCGLGNPTVYTRVSSFASWIAANRF